MVDSCGFFHLLLLSYLFHPPAPGDGDLPNESLPFRPDLVRTVMVSDYNKSFLVGHRSTFFASPLLATTDSGQVPNPTRLLFPATLSVSVSVAPSGGEAIHERTHTLSIASLASRHLD
jgi:hypothetical protein